MKFNISYYTEKGKRPNNEDSVSVLDTDGGILAIVADGLGGHADGEIASGQAVTTLNALLRNTEPDEDLLIDAIQAASQEIFRQRNPEQPMHTTVAVLWVGEDMSLAANVGDSRIYQFRDGEVIFQSMDHSVAQMAVLVGKLDKNGIRTSKERNRLTQALGDADAPRVDSEELTVCCGDRFLLCSDGFWEAVTEENMIAAAACTDTAKDWLEAMRKILEDADKPGQDNHTAVAILLQE